MSLPEFHIKVVGVGFGRTGTISLTTALNYLGIRTKHFPGPLTRGDLRTGRKHLEVLEEYQGVANGTGCPYQLIDRTYPGSKFIMTLRRDRDRWLRSKQRYADLEERNWSQFDESERASKRLLREQVYGSFEFDPDLWLASYEDHVQEVRRYFVGRPDDLLEMDISAGDGWDVLCPFLHVPSPTLPFPHENSIEAVGEWYRTVARVWTDLDDCIGRQSTFVLVDDGDLGDHGRRSIPFLERDGRHWGDPADDDTAIAELERMREERGAEFLVFFLSAFWWLDHYAGFHRYLSERYSRVLENERVIAFDLRDVRSATGR